MFRRALRPDSKVDDQIGFAHSLFVVLYDDNGVAYVAESLERIEQALVVAIVEADKRVRRARIRRRPVQEPI